ncbi:DMT family transporter [Clostridium sp. 19966]|uniref:DMT family transporter n=1 Tax=Clostridium sp. 19966 TaxID=2768166 RepID=UPI0028E044DD|nr:DMT family transporter [Clostridium sp. 19966]MDT8718677.1 DMT family transporter [Clostridium sp. 19966]
MIGLLLAIIAGVSMSLQGVFNTRLYLKIGCWQTNLIVQGTAFIFTLIIFLFVRDGNIRAIRDVNKLYLSGGLIGVIITFTVMKSIHQLGTTYAILTILLAQLLSAALIDAFGLFDSTKITFSTSKILGVILMLIGIILFKRK